MQQNFLRKSAVTVLEYIVSFIIIREAEKKKEEKNKKKDELISIKNLECVEE